MRPTRIMVVDANELSRRGVEGSVEELWAGLMVEYSVGKIEQAKRLLREHEIEIVVIDDGQIPMASVQSLVHWCGENKPAIGLLLITRWHNPFYLRSFASHKRSAILLRDEVKTSVLLHALDSIRGGIASQSRRVYEIMAHDIVSQLQQRNREEDLRMLRLLDAGYSVTTIADRLNRSRSTVYRELVELREIFGAENYRELLEKVHSFDLLDE